MSHAAVTALPRVVADAVIRFTEESAANLQNFGEVLKSLQEARASAARLIGSSPDEVALIGPTSLGLSLFANGIDWRPGRRGDLLSGRLSGQRLSMAEPSVTRCDDSFAATCGARGDHARSL